MIGIWRISASLGGNKPEKAHKLLPPCSRLNSFYLQICLVKLDGQVYGILVGSAVRSVINQRLYGSPETCNMISYNLYKSFPSLCLKSHLLLVFSLSDQMDSQSRMNFATLFPDSAVHWCWHALAVSVGDNLEIPQLWHTG